MGEDFWGEKFSWEQKDKNLGDPKMWEIAAEMFSKPPFSNGHDARYTKVKTHLRKLYVVFERVVFERVVFELLVFERVVFERLVFEREAREYLFRPSLTHSTDVCHS